MRHIIIAVALLLLVAVPVGAEQIQWFPLVFNEAAHPPVVIDPTPMPVLVTIGCSQLPDYDGPVEYPTRVEEGYVYQACFPAQICSLGRVGQEGHWTYKVGAGTHTSRVVLAGIQTIVMPGLGLDNRTPRYWLVATQEQCVDAQCIVMAARFLYPFAPEWHSGTYIAILPQNLTRAQANGVGVWDMILGQIVTHTTFPVPCFEYYRSGQPEQWSGQELLQRYGTIQ